MELVSQATGPSVRLSQKVDVQVVLSRELAHRSVGRRVRTGVALLPGVARPVAAPSAQGIGACVLLNSTSEV
jgi:hypothetical protein